MTQTTKRIFALLLALVFSIALLPAALAEDAEAAPPAETEGDRSLSMGRYLIYAGSNGEWDVNNIDETQVFQINTAHIGDTTEYKLNTELVEGGRIKVALIDRNGQMVGVMPPGGDGYTIDAAHAGRQVIYFQMTPKDEWEYFGGYFYITPPPSHHVTVNQPDHGALYVDKTDPMEGETVTLTVIPEQGYFVFQMNAGLVLTKVNDTTYTFTMPSYDVTVNARIEPGPGYYGSVEPLNVSSVTPGMLFTEKESMYGEYEKEVVLSEGDGFRIYYIQVENDWNWIWKVYDFPEATAETAGHIKVFLSQTEQEGYTKIFENSSYGSVVWNTWMTYRYYQPITVAPTEHGTVTAPADAFEEDNIVLGIVPDEGYELDTLTVTDADGNPVEVSENYNFYMPDSPVIVTATFKQAVMYSITVLGSVEGCTVVSSKPQAKEGETITITVTSDNDHELAEISAADADGGEVTLVKVPYSYTRYTFAMPASNVTVTARARERYPLWVGEDQINGDNRADILGDGTVSYDPATRTLTFADPDPVIDGNYGGALINYAGNDSLIINAPNGLHLTGSDSSGAYDAVYSPEADITVNGDVVLDMTGNGLNTRAGNLTLNGSLSGSATNFPILCRGNLTVNGSVNVSNRDNTSAIYCEGSVTITGDFSSVGYGVNAVGNVSIGGDVSIAESAGTDNFGLRSSAGSVAVGGSFSFSGKAQYAVTADQGFTCGGDVTIVNSTGKGIYAANGAVTVVSGTWDVTAVSEPLKAGNGIQIPVTHAVTLPEGGLVTQLDGFYIVTEADGATQAAHVIISPTGATEYVTVTFDLNYEDSEPITVQVPVGGTLDELPTAERVSSETAVWVLLGWYDVAASGLNVGTGTQITTETVFTENTTVYAHWRLPGDVNGDGRVNGADLVLLAEYIKARGVDVNVVPGSVNIDGSEDGRVNGLDLIRLAEYIKARGVGVVIH